jgi:hypothetical protein
MAKSGFGVESERYDRGLDLYIRKERQQTTRPVLIHGRRAEATQDISQLPVRESDNLRQGSGFKFVFGYSTMGGPDGAG